MRRPMVVFTHSFSLTVMPGGVERPTPAMDKLRDPQRKPRHHDDSSDMLPAKPQQLAIIVLAL
jgi:hypothetical protein